MGQPVDMKYSESIQAKGFFYLRNFKKNDEKKNVVWKMREMAMYKFAAFFLGISTIIIIAFKRRQCSF